MHMAQLRQHYDKFIERDTEVIVVGPESSKQFSTFWNRTDTKFIGLPDPEHKVLKLYGQKINLFKLGRMPAQVIIDKYGIARYVHYGKSMSDIPPAQDILETLKELNGQYFDNENRIQNPSTFRHVELV